MLVVDGHVAGSTIVGTASVPSKAYLHPMNEMADVNLGVVPDSRLIWTIRPNTSQNQAENTTEPERMKIPSRKKMTENIVHADDDVMKKISKMISCRDIDDEDQSKREAVLAIDAVETRRLLTIDLN